MIQAVQTVVLLSVFYLTSFVCVCVCMCVCALEKNVYSAVVVWSVL